MVANGNTASQKKYAILDPRGWPKWLSVSSAVLVTIPVCALLGTLNASGAFVLGSVLYWVKLEVQGQWNDRKRRRQKKN